VHTIETATGHKLMDEETQAELAGPFPTDTELLGMAGSSDGYWRAKFYLDLREKAAIREAVLGKIYGYALGRATQIVLHAIPPGTKTPAEILQAIETEMALLMALRIRTMPALRDMQAGKV
jgi:hypothetical protein